MRGRSELEVPLIRAIFGGSHLYRDWLVELLQVLQVRFHHNFFILPRKDIRIHLHSMRSHGKSPSVIVTLAKHTVKIGVKALSGS